MVITKQKSTVDTQKIKKRESKLTTRENYQLTKEASNNKKKERWAKKQ